MVSVVILSLMLLTNADAEIRVDASPCVQEITVRANDALVSDVLKRMADKMQFTLKFDPASDQRVSIQRTATIDVMLHDLLNGKNFMQLNDVRAECDGKIATTQVWVLPRGEAVPYLTYEPEPEGRKLEPFAKAEKLPETLPPPRGVKRSMSEKEWQQMKQDYKVGKIAADPETGKPIPVEEYRKKIAEQGDNK